LSVGSNICPLGLRICPLGLRICPLVCLLAAFFSQESSKKGSAFFRASPEGRIVVSIYTGEGCHLGGIIGNPWAGSETGFGVHVAAIRSFFVVWGVLEVLTRHRRSSRRRAHLRWAVRPQDRYSWLRK
jgi:hypothetical protein